MRLKLKIAYHAVNMLILHMTHYSKSQIFVQKFNFDKTPTFSRVFNANFFWQFFSWNQSCQQLKCPKPQHFHEFFTQKIIDNFLGNSKLNFCTKNEDFEQCVHTYFVHLHYTLSFSKIRSKYESLYFFVLGSYF